MLDSETTHKTLKRFPSFKLCYEKIAHNKVSTDLYLTIPFGKKYFAWFTYIDKKNVCIFLEIASKISQQIQNIFVTPVCFDESLSLGTILYGTIFTQEKQRYFNVEDIHYYKGKPVGGLTDFTIFSFHPRKVFTCGDGGLITTNNDAWAAKLRSMKVFGAEDGEFKNWGTNQRMSNIHGAVLVGQIRRIKEIVNDRIAKAKIYNELLSDIKGIQIPKIKSDAISNYQTYAVFLDRDGIRDKVIEKMGERGIQTQIGSNALHTTPYFNDAIKIGNLNNSYRLFKNLLALPLHSELTPLDQKRTVETLEEILRLI